MSFKLPKAKFDSSWKNSIRFRLGHLSEKEDSSPITNLYTIYQYLYIYILGDSHLVKKPLVNCL